MRLHFTDSGIVRIELQASEARRMLDLAEADGNTKHGFASREVYRDSLPVEGQLLAGIANEATGKTSLTAQVLGPTMWRLLCPIDWLTRQLEPIEAGETSQTTLARKVVVVIEPDGQQ